MTAVDRLITEQLELSNVGGRNRVTGKEKLSEAA
jgi:hypothetical protein